MSNARVKNYVFELIRINYVYSFNFPNAKFKQILTENLILKYFTSIVLSIDNQENLNMMSILIIEITFYTQDIKFFDKILIRILDLHNHLKEFLQESDKYNIIIKFQKNTLVMKKFYGITKLDLKDNSLLKILLHFLKTFIINEDYEVFIDKNSFFKINKLPSQVILNFLAVKNKNSKKVFENMKSKKINIYEPYLYIKHNQIFEYLIEVLKSDTTNTFIGEEILELFLIYSKNIFFFKCIPNEIILKVILDEENLKKYLTNKKFFDLLVGIILISPFNYSSFITQGQLNPKNIIKTSYEFFKKDLTKKILSEIIYMHSDKLKDKMLELCLTSLKDIVKSMKNISVNYKKCLNNQLIRRENTHIYNSNQNNSVNLIHQNIFIGLNYNNALNNQNLNSTNANNLANNSSNTYQNSILFFNPKEKIINLNLMTESSSREDNINNYKDNNNRNQVNFKNCKQFMNRIVIILRIYLQSYFHKFMNVTLNEYLKLNNNLTTKNFSNNYNNLYFSALNQNNQLNSLVANPNTQNIINSLIQANSNNTNFNNVNVNNINNIILAALPNLQNQINAAQNLNLLSNNNLNNSTYSNHQIPINLNSNPLTNITPNINNIGYIDNSYSFQNRISNNNINANNNFYLNNNLLSNSSNNNLINMSPYSLPNNSPNLNSLNNANNFLGLGNKLLNNNFYNLGSSNKEHQMINLNEGEKLKYLSNFYSNFLECLYDIRNLSYFKPSLSLSVLYTLFSLKELLYKFGDELILKTIYLVLNIGWTQYENEIHKIFNENFNIKFRKFEYEKIRAFESPLKKEYINFLSDIIIYNLVDKISLGHNILSTFNSIMKNKTSRESIFMDLCRWNVISKSIRDNMKNEYRNKMQENSQVFIGTRYKIDN